MKPTLISHQTVHPIYAPDVVKASHPAETSQSDETAQLIVEVLGGKKILMIELWITIDNAAFVLLAATHPKRSNAVIHNPRMHGCPD